MPNFNLTTFVSAGLAFVAVIFIMSFVMKQKVNGETGELESEFRGR